MKGIAFMGQTVIEIKGITKAYRKTTVVDNFNLLVEKGHICGLIGPNGAGKTTIMKILAGLTRADSGEISFFSGREPIDACRSKMSFMIEAPIIDYEMTAYDNLAYLRYVKGYPDMGRIDEVLELVGLENTGKKKCRKFSLGMRQRLGIAMALLAKPEILVLDEPVNGLDPEGISDVRAMLKRLVEESKATILISSHLLSELSELCTDFTFINHGKVIESLSAEELRVRCRNYISLRTNDINRTAEVLKDRLAIRDFSVCHGDIIHIFEQIDNIERISKAVTDSGLIITLLYEEGQSLEEYYLKKVADMNEKADKG